MNIEKIITDCRIFSYFLFLEDFIRGVLPSVSHLLSGALIGRALFSLNAHFDRSESCDENRLLRHVITLFKI